MVRSRLALVLVVAFAGCSADGSVGAGSPPPGDDGVVDGFGAFDDRAPPADPVPGGEGSDPVALTGAVEWARGFAGFGDNAGRAVSVSPEGQVVFTGHFWPSVDFGGGRLDADGYDAVVARYDAFDGTFLAANRLGGAGNHYGASVVAGANGITALGGSFSGVLATSQGPLRAAGERDGFVAIRNAAGADLAAFALGGPLGRAEVTAVDASRDGSLYVAGRFSGEVRLGAATLVSVGDWDGFAARIGTAGDVLWIDTIATPGRDAVTGMILLATTDASGAAVDRPTLVGYSGGGAADTGRTGVVRHLDRAGTLQWSDAVTASADAVIAAVATAPGDRVLVAGTRAGGDLQAGADGFVSSYAGGELEWTLDLAGPGADEVLAMAVTATGETLLTGRFETSLAVGDASLESAGGADIFVAKVSAAGQPLWAHGFGWVGDDAGMAVAARADGGAVVTGQYAERIDFGTGPLPFSSQRDIFLLGLAP